MSRIVRIVRTWGVALAGLAVLLAAIAWLSGYFTPKTDPGSVPGEARVVTGEVVPVEMRIVPRISRAIGTIRAVHETAVGSQLLAPIERVHVSAGQPVTKNQVLVELSKADIEARLRQMKASLDAVRARQAKASNDLEKIRSLSERGAATPQELHDAERAADVAAADVDAAEQFVAEVTTQLSYATIRSPFNGIVIEKLVEEGDLARPGQSLITLYDPDRLQLEAEVPERLGLGMKVGEMVEVEIEAIGLRCEGEVSEIVPQASPASRSLLVKVTGPCPPGVFSGMFGRMLIQDGERTQLLVPAEAVRSIGQLEMVQVVSGSGSSTGPGARTVERRFVRTGEHVDGRIEVLSGLQPGDEVQVPFSDT